MFVGAQGNDTESKHSPSHRRDGVHMNPNFDADYDGVLTDAEAFITSLLGEDGFDTDPEWDWEDDL